MESNEASAQLKNLDRLRSATRAESHRTPPAAWPVMLAAMAVFLGSFTFVRSDAGREWESVGWTAFVVAWSAWLRFGRMAVPDAARRRRVTVRAVVGWVVLFGVLNLVVIAFSRVSWALVGVLVAAVMALAGLLAGRAKRA